MDEKGTDRLNDILERYINGGCLTRADVLLAMFAPSLPARRNARRVGRLVGDHESASRPQEQAVAKVAVDIPVYEGINPHVLALREEVCANLRQDLLGALVHGSLATGEELPYSDFDALVIIKSEVFAEASRLARVAERLDRARSTMLALDPLQHHGWFVLAEHQLGCYPESYLPAAALRRARALLPETGILLELSPVLDRGRFVDRLNAASGRLLAQLARPTPPRNPFEAKALLSEFMLLPALYVQARDGAGVFKGDSFAIARRDLDPEVWAIMDEVSEIRREWAVRVTGLRRMLLGARWPVARRLARWIPWSMPRSIASRLDGDFYRRMADFTREIRDALDGRRTATGLLHGG